MTEQPTKKGVRIIGRIFLIAVLFESVIESFQTLYSLFVVPRFAFAGIESFLLIQFWTTPLFFLISPVLLFAVFYRQAKRFSLGDEYRSIAVSLFAGGFFSGVLYFGVVAVAVLINTGYNFPGFPAFELSSANVILVFAGLIEALFALIGRGLDIMFTGFFAFAVADLRRRESSPQLAPMQTSAG